MSPSAPTAGNAPVPEIPRPACRPIIVLGVDRSGTSLVAETVARWGAYAGPEGDLASADEHNPHGYWEHQPMEDFLDELFTATGVSMWHPALASLVERKADEERFRNAAEALVAAMESAGGPWVWKEPYLSLSLPFWERIWRDPLYVITVRDPQESARSYQKAILPPQFADGLRLRSLFFLRWQHFLSAIFRSQVTRTGSIVVSYEKLVASPRTQCERLARFLGVRLGLEPRPDAPEVMAAAVDPSLRRNRSGLPFWEATEATEEQKLLYEFLLERADDSGAPTDSRASGEIPDWGREYLENFDALWTLIKSRTH